jgi:uncharacterized protein (DUF934 family)
MPSLIKQRAVVDDVWTVLRLAADDNPQTVALPAAALIVPLAVWRARRDELLARAAPLGVWLAPTEGPEQIADALDAFDVIAIDFPKFTDGRGYSHARLLRERHGWRGELRAIGDVLRDQLFYLRRAGFDAFRLRDGQDLHAALAAFDDFEETYQSAADQPLPLFRRRPQIKDERSAA